LPTAGKSAPVAVRGLAVEIQTGLSGQVLAAEAEPGTFDANRYVRAESQVVRRRDQNTMPSTGRERTIRVLLFVTGFLPTAALLEATAVANGAVVRQTRTTALGGVVPIQSHEIRLVAETLRIRVSNITLGSERWKSRDRGRAEYWADATYTLSNPGGPTKVRYGVPILTVDFKAAARTIQISVGGRRYGCEPVETVESGADDRVRRTVAGLNKKMDDQFLMMAGGTGWCVATITIPAGMVKLNLRYHVDLLFGDFEGPEGFWHPVTRVLHYALWPAGYWSGNVERVDVAIDLGPRAAFARVIGPPGFTREGRRVSWTLRDVDLKRTPDLRVDYDLDPVFRFREMAALNGDLDGKTGLAVVASSTRAGDSRAENVTDGKLTTSWCSGEADGRPWIEARLLRHPFSYEQNYRYVDMMRQLLMAARPGRPARELLHDSPSLTWPEVVPSVILVHGRGGTGFLRRVRLGVCGDSGADADYTLPSVRLQDQAAARLALEGKLLTRYRRALDAWHGHLRQLALTCARGCMTADRKCKQDPDPLCPLLARQPCETRCFDQAARAASSSPSRPCLRLTVLEADGPRARACVRELAISHTGR